MVKVVNDHGMEEAILKGKGYIIGAFVQVGSIPCGHFLPELRALSEALSTRARFFILEVTENPTLAADLDIQGVPTTVVWKDAEELARYEGPYNRRSLNDRILALMAGSKRR
jgi:thioredoxin-like negative regulator of GroEL